MDKFITMMAVFSHVIILALSSFTVQASAYKLPQEGSRLIGRIQHHTIVKGDYFQSIAEQYNVGFLGLIAANPHLDPFLPKIGDKVTIPSQMLLPFISHEGIVVNLPELRLYYFLPDQNKVMVFPVGIGKEGFPTPKTVSYVSIKTKDPSWIPTPETKARHFAKHGKKLANIIPAGPDNPFGKYSLRLGTSVYLLHGTNQRFGIGMRASSGCIRMYDDDIKWLYENTPLNTKVRIIEQPVKMSYENATTRLIEIHEPLSDSKEQKVNEEGIYMTESIQYFIGHSKKVNQFFKPYLKKPKGLVLAIKKAPKQVL
jgi:lipoprotein-anchoring transpeptidase ErfK/SrfK